MGAQSGRSSAVGFCIESAFRSAPLTLAGGSNYALGITGTNPLRFMIMEPGGGYSTAPTKDVGENENDGDFEIHRVTMTGKMYEGKDSYKFDPENSYYNSLGVFGRDVETQLAVGAYKHVFTHNKYMPSFAQEEQFGDATSGRLSTGVCIYSQKMTHGAILTAEMDYYAHRQIPNTYPAGANVDTDYDFTSAYALLPSQLGGDGTKQTKLTVTPSYVDVAEGNDGNGPLVFANMSFGTEGGNFANSFITIDDVPYDAKFLPGFTNNRVRSVERFMTGGSGYDASTPVADLFKVDGTMDILFTDNTIPAKINKNAKFGINMKFQGAQIGSTGFYYTYELYMPRVKFLKDKFTRTDKALITGGDYVAEKDPSLGYSCKVTLINSYTHAGLAGTYPQPGGGLGGWQSA